MRALFSVLASVCLSISVFATTTVQGTIRSLGTSAVSNGTFVRFTLQGCSSGTPTVAGTAIFAPTGSGPQYHVDFAPNASGVISGTLYSTRDSTGLLAGEITCNGSQTNTWYSVVVFQNGRGGNAVPVHARNGIALDVTNLSAISPPPPTTDAATGDARYCQLSGANCGFSGPITTQNVTPNITATYDLGSSTFKWRDGWFSRSLSALAFKTNSANPASAGIVQLASGDTACWRNNANSADICVSKNASDQIVLPTASIGGGALSGTFSGSPTLSGTPAMNGGYSGMGAATTVYSGSNVSITATSFTAVTGMSVTLTTRGGKVLVTATFPASVVTDNAVCTINQDSSADTLGSFAYLDGTGLGSVNSLPVSINYLFSPSANSHTYQLRCKLVAHTTGALGINMASNAVGILSAVEVSQ
jgi:hypothetical protein